MQLASLQRLNMHTIATLIYVHPLTGMNTSCRSSLALIRVSLLPTAGATATSSSAGVSNTAHIIPRQERERENTMASVCLCAIPCSAAIIVHQIDVYSDMTFNRLLVSEHEHRVADCEGWKPAGILSFKYCCHFYKHMSHVYDHVAPSFMKQLIGIVFQIDR